MNISPEEALSLLRKWREENRLIQCTLVSSKTTSASVVGRITELEIDSVRVTAAPHCGVLFTLSDALELNFQDWRDAPAEDAQQLKEAYEAFLFVRFHDCNCEVYALKTVDELPPA